MENSIVKYLLIGFNSTFVAYNIGYFLPSKIMGINYLDFTITIFSALICIFVFILTSMILGEESGSTIKLPSSIQNIDDHENSLLTTINNLRNLISKMSDSQNNTIIEFLNRTVKLLNNSTPDKSFDVLYNQYTLSVENEKFYEKTIWRIASIFIPVSLTLPAISIGNKNYVYQLAAGLIIFYVFLLLFQRFRISIRLFRDFALLLEKVLGLYSHTYVYNNMENRFVLPVRVWIILVNIGFLYTNCFVYFIIANYADK